MEKHKISIILIFIAVTFLISTIPYEAARIFTPPHHRFLGQVTYTTDQNMYFSFIRQAYDGKVLFNNRLTNQANGGAFFNLQFFAIGFLMKVFHLSENTGYQLWRLLGTIILVGAFGFLSTLFISSLKRWILAMTVFCLGGGFGIIPIAAFKTGLISKELMTNLSYDVWGGIHPFQQIVSNPHFSLPHGLVLIGFGLFLLAERKERTLYYILSGLVFTINGFIRPYDLISILAIFPLFILIESLLTGIKLKLSLNRLLPVMITLPVLGYNIWLFKFNEYFKHWSLQGHNIKSLPDPHWQLMAFGIVAILGLLRFLRIKSQPLNVEERFLAVWFFMILGLEYIGLLIPALGFSPQIGASLISPLILLGFSIKGRIVPFINTDAKTQRGILIGVLFLLVIIGNAGVSVFYSLKFILHTNTALFYAHENEINAWEWINVNLEKENVVLALPNSSNRLAKFTSERTIAGHYSVTPDYIGNEKMVNSFFSCDKSSPVEKGKLINKMKAQYVYFGPEEKDSCADLNENLSCLKRIYSNGSVSIYKVTN